MARVVERATGRAVCLAFSEALERYGPPEEVLTDNGKQFTDRFGRGGEVLFDKICRRNAITHRLTQPSSPTTTGKIERFHQTLRRELLNEARPFTSLLTAQAALNDWLREYNATRPHQALETKGRSRRPSASSRPRSSSASCWGCGCPARSPASLSRRACRPSSAPSTPVPASPPPAGRSRFDRVVPASGNLWAMGRQFWLGSQRASQTESLCAAADVIALSIAAARVKSLRSHLSTADLARLANEGAVAAGPPPLPLEHDGAALEVDRAVNRIVSLAWAPVAGADVLGGG